KSRLSVLALGAEIRARNGSMPRSDFRNPLSSKESGTFALLLATFRRRGPLWPVSRAFYPVVMPCSSFAEVRQTFVGHSAHDGGALCVDTFIVSFQMRVTAARSVTNSVAETMGSRLSSDR